MILLINLNLVIRSPLLHIMESHIHNPSIPNPLKKILFYLFWCYEILENAKRCTIIRTNRSQIDYDCIEK